MRFKNKHGRRSVLLLEDESLGSFSTAGETATSKLAI
jgi:hypothetical protein